MGTTGERKLSDPPMVSSLSQYWANSRTPAVPSGVHVFQGARNVQIHGGTVNAAGRDTITINNFHWPHNPQADLASKIKDWLAPNIHYRNIQIDTFNKRAPDTGTWFLESNEFRQWLEVKDGVLWGIGIPGAGKTILASTLINHLQKLAEKSGQGKISVAFAYCRYTDSIPVKVILAALLCQLLEDHPGLVEIIEPLYAKHQRHNTQPTQDELVDLLIKISSMFETIFFVLDGLDEAPHDDQCNLIRILASVKAHLIITSRPLKSLEHVLPDVVFFEVAARREEIRAHVIQRIDQMPDLGRLLDRHSFKEELISTICEQAGGMFLHAILQVEMLRSCLTIKKVKQALKGLPTKYEDMYIVTLNRICMQSPERAALALRILLWLVFAQRSLSVEELQYAVSVDTETHTFDPEDIVDEELLVSVCCGLVTVDVESQRVRLIHFTAKDALAPALLDDFPDPHGFLASTCISRLISCQFHNYTIRTGTEFYNALWRNPLLRYACDAWYVHAKQSGPSSLAIHDVLAFIRSCHSFPIVINLQWYPLDCINGLHLAAYCDLLELVDVDLDCNTPTLILELTPLMVALLGYQANPRHRSLRIAMLLLQTPGIQVNALAKDGLSALELSVMSGYEDVVEQLLRFSDIGINAVSRTGWTMLMMASENGHDRVVELLLQHPGVEVNAADSDGQTALMRASLQGHDRVVKLLLGHPRVEANSADSKGWTSLMWSSRNGHDGVVKLLLGHPEVKVNATDRDGWSALLLASYSGYERVMGLLLGHPGVEANATNSQGQTALMLASEQGYSCMVQLLLGHLAGRP